MTATDLERFRWRTSITAPKADEGDHVGGIPIAQLLHDAAMCYLAEVLGLDDLQALAIHDGERPILRQLSTSFEAELHGDEPITIGVRAQSRSRRAFVLETGLWADDDRRLVAAGTVSLVMFDVGTGSAVEIPDGLWAAIQTIDGRRSP